LKLGDTYTDITTRTNTFISVYGTASPTIHYNKWKGCFNPGGVISVAAPLPNNVLSVTESKNLIKGDLVMVCHTPPLEKAKKQGEMPLPILSPISFQNVDFRDGMADSVGELYLTIWCFG